MSAAIQLVSPQIIHSEKTWPDKTLADIESFSAGSTEQRLRRAVEYIHELQAELRTMHAELARAERALGHRDTLLRNAMLREQELRAQLVKGAF